MPLGKNYPGEIDLAKRLYSHCGGNFDLGKLPFSAMPLIIKMRNFLVHDKPTETMDAEVNEKVDQFSDSSEAPIREFGRKFRTFPNTKINVDKGVASCH